MIFRLVLVLLAFSGTGIGCAKDRDPNDDLNQLWRGGYGFNNPNVERIQNGQEPLNFDGSK